MSIRQTIRSYILENLLFTDDESVLNNSDSFLAEGILDSTGILEIMFFIEETYGFQVNDDEMLPENLDSVDNLVAFVERKQTAPLEEQS